MESIIPKVMSFSNLIRKDEGCGKKFFDLPKLPIYTRLPHTIRILLESSLRNGVTLQNECIHDVERILNWEDNQFADIEVQFMPARVVLQDFTGVPAIVDLAAMRDAVKELGGDHTKVNPNCPTDLVIDHSVQVDFAGNSTALEKNSELEFERNKERFGFLKWGSTAFVNTTIVPPGCGIVHQVNLEYLSRVVFLDQEFLYPDSVVGTDSHTTMINGMGVLGWGVGGIEAEAVMMGLPMSMVLPQVIGYKITGELSEFVTSTDLVLTVTKHLRDHGVVGKFIEFFGPGVAKLSIADRATISNMCPEYGATTGYFAVDSVTMDYLKLTNRSEKVPQIEEYLKLVGLFRDYSTEDDDIRYTETLHLDLSTITPCISGPKRPQDKVDLKAVKHQFRQGLEAKVTAASGYGIPAPKLAFQSSFTYKGKEYSIGHGSVLLAAITSCTNTSNPSVMLGAGLLARNAIKSKLSIMPYIKTSLSPGSGVVTYYLKHSGTLDYLTKLGFDIVGYGCMTCIGNSGPLEPEVGDVVEKADLVCCGVLSGNRNFEGRIHPLLRANYLASPLLVIAYAIAGRIDIDFETEPIGTNGETGAPLYLREIWPTRSEIQAVEQKHVLPSMFKEVYSSLRNRRWDELAVPEGLLYHWDEASTYIKRPPFMEGIQRQPQPTEVITNAYVLLNLGDSVTTDHISPAGSISRTSPAARYLSDRGLTPQHFNSYGSRRGNDAVMARGTFANIRLVNKLVQKPGPRTIYLPTGEEMDVFTAAERYRENSKTVIILAGKEYGSGSSRDWAAKGPMLLGVRAVIAESYERIHRSNLIGMGILPLQYTNGQNASSLGLTGTENFDIPLTNLGVKKEVVVKTSTGLQFPTLARIDTESELAYFKNGGILPFLVRRICA